ncbi:MAG: hypothetical protein ACHQCI_00180 [Solirubrobacterales bacterium]|jgi:hypothetical protein
MPKGTKAEKAWEASRSAADNEYVRRLIEDEDLRENLQDAYRSAKKAYGRVNNGAPAKRLMDDKKVHRELKSAAESLREASDQLRGKRESHTFRNLVLLAIVGGILAIALSEDLRKAVLDRLFGAEEEFEYTSTTTTSAAAS